MERPLRGEKSPIPRNLGKYLNEQQLNALDAIEKFGWAIAFIRRPLFQQAKVFVVNRVGKRFGILLEDGSLDQEGEMHIREEMPAEQAPQPRQSRPRKKVSKSKATVNRKSSNKTPVRKRA